MAISITIRHYNYVLPAKYLDVAILISKTKNKNNKTTHTKNTLTDDVTATVRAVNDFFFIAWTDSR